MILLWIFFAVLPVSIAHIFGGIRSAFITGAVVGVILIFEAIRSEARLRKVLKPSMIEIGGEQILAIEDPSSHVFATQSFFSVQPTLWITRGALSLLSPDEITTLLRGMRVAARVGGLRFETFLTLTLVRLTTRIPSGFRDILFFREKRAKSIHIRESARAAFWTSLVLTLERFYLSRRTSKS